MSQILKNRFAALIKEQAAQKAKKLAEFEAQMLAGLAIQEAEEAHNVHVDPKHGDLPSVSPVAAAVRDSGYLSKDKITIDLLNSEQAQAPALAKAGKSFCLIGSAGTGKTTTQRVVVDVLKDSGGIGTFTPVDTTSDIFVSGMLRIAILSFTNKAVNNIREALPDEFKQNATTFHSVLEFHPIFEETDVVDSYGLVTGTKTIMKFIPRFGVTSSGEGLGETLPHFDVVIVEEAGSVPTDLFNIFFNALPNSDKTLFIFLGDLNQLPPVFGDAVLGFKLLDLPIVELVTPYRAALESPITRLANTVKDGITLTDEQLKQFEELNSKGKGKITVTPFTGRARSATPEKMAASFGTYLYGWVKSGELDLDDSVVLVPYNKGFGSIELNRWIGQALSDKFELDIHQVIAGEQIHHFSIGDKVMFNKTECVISGIELNKGYAGHMPLAASRDIDRWGRNKSSKSAGTVQRSIDEMLDAAAAQLGDAGKVRQASHIIKLRSLSNPDYELEASTAGEVNSLLFLWCLSIHKSQGSEYRKVILVLHDSHKVLWRRELIYTGITRAREELEIFYTGQHGHSSTSAFQIGVKKSEYNAVTLEGKLDYFRKQRYKAELAAKRNPDDLKKYSKGL